MTIPNDNRLAFLRHTTATQSSTYTEVERFEFISILDELMLSRARFGAVAGGAAADINAGLTVAHPFEPYGKPTDIEALAQRLAKVEDRLAGTLDRDLGESFRRINARLGEAATDARLDQVCEIIGARIGGLEERLARLEQAPERFVLSDNVKITDAPFPTGAGTTVEDAVAYVQEAFAESEPLKPQRGDRVRLEGARSIGNTKLEDRWFDVLGQEDDGTFQVEAGFGRFWVMVDDPGLKEVRRGAANLPE